MKPEIKKVADELLKHLKAAHSLIENTEAFGRTASHGILQCGDSIWRIDDSKAAIAAYEAQPAEPCVSSVSDKTDCGAQNVECETQTVTTKL